MIYSDQPQCFNDDIIAKVSSRDDGQMQLGWSQPDQEVIQNREAFLNTNGLSLERTVLVRIRYTEQSTYGVIKEVNENEAGKGMKSQEGEVADCLITKTPNLGLFLPIADCIGTIIFDPTNRVLALAHLGRHSTIAGLAKKTVQYFVANFKSDPSQLIVWMSPSIEPPFYVLKTADFVNSNVKWKDFCKPVEGGYSLDLPGFNQAEFMEAGVLTSNINFSHINTATSKNYWSHYTETTVRKHPAPPRFAVVAALTDVV